MVSFVVILIGFKLSPEKKNRIGNFTVLFYHGINTFFWHGIIGQNEWNSKEKSDDHQNELNLAV